MIKDTFEGQGIHTFELNYHLRSDAMVSNLDKWWCIDNGDEKIFMLLLDEVDFNHVKGEKEPILGWYSPSYGVKHKSGVLTCTKTGYPNEVSFVSMICAENPVETETIEQRLFHFGY